MKIHPVLWKVQLWLGDQLIEEHIAPPDLAEQYANVIRLRIRNLPGRRLRCEPVSEPATVAAQAEIRGPGTPLGPGVLRGVDTDRSPI
jgi:hypothetical protein